MVWMMRIVLFLQVTRVHQNKKLGGGSAKFFPKNLDLIEGLGNREDHLSIIK